MSDHKALDALKKLTTKRQSLNHLKTLTAIKQAVTLTVEEYDAALSVDQPLDPIERKVYQQRYDLVFHQTGDTLAATQAAVGALRRHRLQMPVKTFKSATDYLVMGWGALFTDADQKDTDDTYFQRDTRFFLDYYKNAPLWAEHGYDGWYGIDPIGERVEVLEYSFGLYAVHRLHTNHPNFKMTCQRCDNREYGYSLDSLRHFLEHGYKQDGKLGAFPAAGWSLVHYPAEPGVGFVQLKKPENTASPA